MTSRNCSAPCSYHLTIELDRPVRIVVGRLGRFEFPPGRYVYTGSARRGLEARIARHLRADKTLRWHIDYLPAAPGVRVTGVIRSADPECRLSETVGGRVVVPGFGATDCRHDCGGHLRFLSAA